MSVLLKEIRHINSKAASVLEKADFCTDSAIQSLTREDLNELFPGASQLKLRKTIFDTIHKQKPIEVLMKELKEFIPHESLSNALTENGILVDYLHILKDMKTQMNHVQTFLDAHIRLLEDIRKPKTEQEPNKASLSGTSGPVEPHTGQADLQGAGVMYQMVISGKTFDAHRQLMDKVRAQVQDQVLLNESEEDGDIIIVFCPISSRVQADVSAAMTKIEGNKPVIMVLMHHRHDAKITASTKTWSDNSNIVLYVNVFYHETRKGLLQCEENNVAASQILSKLQEYMIPRSTHTSGNAYSVNAVNSRNDGGSHSDSENSGSLSWLTSRLGSR